MAERGAILLSVIPVILSLGLPAPGGGAPADLHRSQSSDPVLDSVRSLMPEALDVAGARRTDLRMEDAGFVSVSAAYTGEGGPIPRIEVSVSRGLVAQRSVHESVVGGVRREGRIVERTIDGVPVFQGTIGERAVLAAFPGRFVVVLSGETKEGTGESSAPGILDGAYRRILAAAVAPLVEGGLAADAGGSPPATGSVHTTVVWPGLSFSLERPASWVVADLGGGSPGVRALVLIRDPDVPAEPFGPAGRDDSGEVPTLGSAENVVVVLTDAGAGEAASAAGHLRGLRSSDHLAGTLRDGRPTGPVGLRSVGGDSLPAFPYRGRDREGREVRGRVYAIGVSGRILRAHLLVGEAAPAAAVDTAEGALGSVGPVGGS